MGWIEDMRAGMARAAISAAGGSDDGNGPDRNWLVNSDDDVSPEEMSKALAKKGVSIAQPVESNPRAMFHDPYSVMDWGGWRQRPSSLTYETLRQMSVSNTVIASILTLRTNQVAAFCKPQQGQYDKGYRIIMRDRRDKSKGMSRAEQKEAEAIERFIETTGLLLPDEKPSDRDSFRAFSKKATRDTLTYDQWCLTGDTLIQMADGSLKPICAVQPGDKVITHKGRVRRVTEVKTHAHTGAMVRLRYRGQEITATDGHPFYVERGPHLALRHKWKEPSYTREWVDASEIEQGQYLTAPDVEPFGQSVSVRSRARVLGLYVGDGHRAGTDAVWTFHEDETDLVDAVVAIFPDARVEPYEDRAAVRVRVLGEGEWFASRCGEGSGNKRVPRDVLYGTQDVRDAFLRGYLEADGHLRMTGAVASTTSLELRGGITLLAAMRGMFISWSKTANDAYGWATCWQGRFSGDAWGAFALEVGFPYAKPTRPKNPTVHADGYHYLKVNRVEHFQVEGEQVFNLEVEEDESYIANGIVSHNCWEKIRDRKGRMSKFIALPSETIRPAVSDIEHLDPEQLRSRVSHVQVYENQVIAEFAPDDIAFCVMNPRSDIRANGFGFSPIEQVIRLTTAWLFGFEYNTRFFTQGSAIKGLINIKGAIPDRQLRAFRRMWYSMISGVSNAWKTPIVNADEIQWLSMHSTNREMEYGAWMDWLTKLICAIYGVDPIEINFIYGAGGGDSMFSSRPNAQEVIESKDKGLRPLLTHIEDHINQHMIWDINPDFEFAYTGFDAKAEDKEREALLKEVAAIRTVNEGRALMNEEPLPDDLGDVILNPVFIQYLQMKQGAGAEGGEGGEGDDENDFSFGDEGGGDFGDDDSDSDGGDSEADIASQSGGEDANDFARSFRTETLSKSRDGRLKYIDIWLPKEG